MSNDEHKSAHQRGAATLSPVEQEIGWATVFALTSWKKAPRRLKPVGFWTTGMNSLLPDPAKLVDRSWSQRERKAVLAYLRTGSVKARYLGVAYCRCGCENHVPGSADMTDGVWVWPEGLPHYVEVHNVRLPEDFVHYVMERS